MMMMVRVCVSNAKTSLYTIFHCSAAEPEKCNNQMVLHSRQKPLQK